MKNHTNFLMIQIVKVHLLHASFRTRKKSTLYFIETEYQKRCSECLSSAPDFLLSDELKAYSNGSDGETSSSVAKEDADGDCDGNLSTSFSVGWKHPRVSDRVSSSFQQLDFFCSY